MILDFTSKRRIISFELYQRRRRKNMGASSSSNSDDNKNWQIHIYLPK
jgi:hypothetical protein